MGDLRSLLPAEVAIASGLWAPQTRSWLGLSYDEHRPGSHRQTEHRVLARPLGRSIAQTRDANPARQSPLDGTLHEFGCEEGERDRHIDLSNAAFLARGNLLDTTVAISKRATVCWWLSASQYVRRSGQKRRLCNFSPHCLSCGR